MNKTVSINLGGFFFHIDEDAYQKLTRYFQAIKISLSADAKDEVMKDIESRVAELFSEKLTNNKEVIGILEVDHIIGIMGQPEDYIIENEEVKTTSTNKENQTLGRKKLFRDLEGGSLGGVASGLGYYFGIDKVWLRIIIVLLTFLSFGTSVIAYLILWAVTPAAISTSEKLEMQGEPINISNIEKKVRAEYENFSEKFKNTDFDKMGNQVKSSAEKISSNFGGVFTAIINILGKIAGGFMVFVSSIVIIALLISLITAGTTTQIGGSNLNNYLHAFNYSGFSVFIIGLLVLFAIGIPFFVLLYLGLKILVTNLNSLGNSTKYALVGIWVLSVASLIFIGIKQSSELAFENKIIEKKNLNIKPTDTLQIKFVAHDVYSNSNFNHFEHNDFKIVSDSSNQNFIYSTDVAFEILPTEENFAYAKIEKYARGVSLKTARERATKINYNFEIKNNKLLLNNYFLSPEAAQFRGQEIKIYLYLPKGTLFKTDNSVEHYDYSDNDYFNLHYSSSNYVYKVGNEKVNCLNCPKDEDEFNQVDSNFEERIENTTIKINENGVSIQNDSVKTNASDFKELKINKDGLIIKTK